MSLQDQLRGMLYSADDVTFQNGKVYSTQKIGKKKRTPLKEDEEGKEKVVSDATPYTAKTFLSLWDSKKQEIIDKLGETLPINFDYIFRNNGTIHLYLREKATRNRHLKPESLLSYEPDGQIKISPVIDTEKDKVERITVQAKYNSYGDDFNKRTITVMAPTAGIDTLISEIVDTAYTLAKNLSII